MYVCVGVKNQAQGIYGIIKILPMNIFQCQHNGIGNGSYFVLYVNTK